MKDYTIYLQIEAECFDGEWIISTIPEWDTQLATTTAIWRE